ncbi:hypothetical protein CLG96_00090 [Sphingomonas oleivorans]|uniref:Uncharacterized protein n=1 Tax=Sphingomonas oleivorans TaxID=1735121 RepID=A0A2T5G3A4_9SPHN|nr:hypothetical protein [Sphingomonas oleivorans]PTQ13720.1 hypothetical protein CLG96_00090 [Sphingomonas oleivorans]
MLIDPSQFTGPLGGLLSLAFASGAIAGWGFAMKLMSSRIAELKADCEKRDCEQKEAIAKLEARLTELDNFLLHGMERQLAQLRQPSAAVPDGAQQ